MSASESAAGRAYYAPASHFPRFLDIIVDLEMKLQTLQALPPKLDGA